jgi:type IV secretory pathway VirB9-like protein
MRKTLSLRKRPCRALLAMAVFFLTSIPAAFGSPSDTARTVKYSREEIIRVRAKLRFSTLIVLPDNEEILDFTTGDKEFWIINGAHNLCYVHPAQAGIRSNLNLITSSGNVYSFLLTEISSEPNAEPDLKLFVEPRETGGTTNLTGYVRASEADAYRREIERLHSQSTEQLQMAHAQATEEINRFRSGYAAKLRFDYSVDGKPDSAPFLVSAIYHDDLFTYIRCDAREKPALYELKDAKPNLINFQLEGSVYIAPKIIDSGYLVVGKKKLSFTRHAAGK